MKICSIVGARPQFVKAAVVSRALAGAGISEDLVHTGQHYDWEMSESFFSELKLRPPIVNLGVGSESHAVQTAKMMTGLEDVLLERTDISAVLVYGDTNSTVAGALVAAKLGLPVVHVEAGLRSFNKRMAEELNRIVTDRLSDLLFCPTDAAVQNLASEGIADGVFLSGDVMLEAVQLFATACTGEDLDFPAKFYLATVHRAENTDNLKRLQQIFTAFGRLDHPVVLPLHPRTRRLIHSINIPANVELREPIGYAEMLWAIRNALKVLTDSGGIQKEAYWLETPCVTMRDETEWIDTVHDNWNIVVGADADRIVTAAVRATTGPTVQSRHQHASAVIVGEITRRYS